MVGHKRFTVATDVQVYFCDPQNLWQRDTTGLYLPKGIDISGYSQDACKRSANYVFPQSV